MTREESNGFLERFIRGELGCQCPDEVFQEIGVESCPRSFGHWPRARLIGAGGRLLILVLYGEDGVVIERALPALVAAGRRMRDVRGFNRFRLVVVTSRPEVIASSLIPCFENLEEKDDRVHLHVVASDRVPELSLERAPNG